MPEPISRTRRPLIALLALSMIPSLSQAAKRLEPPTVFVHAEQNKTAILETTAISHKEGLVDFTLREALQGDTPKAIRLRFGQHALERVEVGGTYLIGYTELWRPRNRRTSGYQVDPKGPRLLEMPVVGPAVFEDTPAMRLLGARPAEGKTLPPRATLDALLEQVRRPDLLSRRFVLTELALRGDLRELADTADVAVLKEVLLAGDLEPYTTELLLRAAKPMAGSWGRDWMAAGCREIVAAHGVELDLSSPIPSLLVTALETLGATGGTKDAELARRHLPSNNPGVGKAAFRAMAALDPELTAALAAELVSRPDLHPDTRRVAQQFVDAASKGPATGGG